MYLYKKNNILKLDKKRSTILSILIIFIVTLFNTNFDNIINFKERFAKSINTPDIEYLSEERISIIYWPKGRKELEESNKKLNEVMN